MVAALEDEHRAPGARQVGGGDEAVVPAADDHDVVSGVARHQSANRWRVDRHEAVDVVDVAVELGDDDRVLLARLDAQVLDRRLVALGQRALLGVGAGDLARQLRVAAQRGGQRLDVGLGRAAVERVHAVDDEAAEGHAVVARACPRRRSPPAPARARAR